MANRKLRHKCFQCKAKKYTKFMTHGRLAGKFAGEHWYCTNRDKCTHRKEGANYRR